MSSKYKFYDPDGLYFITYAVVYWVDVFTRDEYRNILIDSWKHCQKEKGLVIHAWIIMTNHIHMIVSKNGETLLQDIMRDMKKYTSLKILSAIRNNEKESRREWMLQLFSEAGKTNSNNKDFQFWKQDNHPFILFTEKFFDQKINYLHENPVRAGLVNQAEDWTYSSAADYCGKRRKEIVELVKL
jgi:REP element-mobilizing transposase RayT